MRACEGKVVPEGYVSIPFGRKLPWNRGQLVLPGALNIEKDKNNRTRPIRM